LTTMTITSTAPPIRSKRVRKALKLNSKQFKRLFGVTKNLFDRMLNILQVAFIELRKRGGKQPTRMRVEDKLLLTLQYWREYRTMEHLAYEYETVKSYICTSIEWVENTLIRDDLFHLPGKKALIAGEHKPKAIAIDVTESPIERPKKSKKSGIPVRKNNIRYRHS